MIRSHVSFHRKALTSSDVKGYWPKEKVENWQNVRIDMPIHKETNKYASHLTYLEDVISLRWEASEAVSMILYMYAGK